MNKADLHAFLDRLRAGRSHLTADQKRKSMAALAQALKTNRLDGGDKDLLEAIHILIGDEDWHVRQDLAELLLFVPEPVFQSLMPRLLDDINDFVRRSADRTIVRRQRATREAKRALHGMDLLDGEMAAFVQEHGEDVARKALRLCARQYELINAEVVHDYLNLLGAIKENVRVLRAGSLRENEETQHAARDALDNVDLFERALRDFLGYSVHLSLDSRPESLPFVVRRAKKQALGALHDRGVDIKGILIDQQGVPDVDVRMTLGLVVQAMANLIINAVEAHATIVRIKAVRRPGWIDIAIKDNGDGLSPQKLAIARRFLPGRKNRKKTHSTGFGLCNVKKNIEAHGGKVSLDSVQGEGMTVTLSLPL